MSEEQIHNNSMKISELPILSAAAETSWFIIERGTNSYKINYNDLKNYIFSNIDSIMNLGSIIYHDKEEYSKFAHGHDYTDFWFFPSYGPQSNNDEYKDISKCQHYGTFSIRRFLPGIERHDGDAEYATQLSLINVCSHEFLNKFENQLSAYNPHKVGDLQFLALGQSFQTYLTAYRGYTLKEFNNGTLTNIDINHPSFDGYVIPNGTTFSCNKDQFKQACLTYAGNEYATEFTIPALDSFFKCNPGTYKSNAMEKHNYQNGISCHNHNQKLQVKYDSSDALSVNLGSIYQFTSATKGTYKRGFVHGGMGKKYNSKPAQITINNLKAWARTENVIINSIVNDNESYPNYNDVQVLLYIGDK